MINSEDDIYIDFKSSLTKDEAVAKLLGWLNGNRRVKIAEVPDGVLSPSFFAKLHTLEGSLQSMLQTYRDIASNAFVDAFEKNNEYDDQVQALDIIVKEWDSSIDKAAIYFMDIDDELSKGEKSSLRIVPKLGASKGLPHITMSSLNEWAQSKYGVAIYPAFEPISQKQQENLSRTNTLVEAVTAIAKPKQKLRLQENIILDEIKKLNLDSKLLPKRLEGSGGTKLVIRTALKDNALFKGTSTVFDKAWERLRADGAISELK